MSTLVVVIILLESFAALWALDSGPLSMWDSPWWFVCMMVGVVQFVGSLTAAVAAVLMALLS